MRVDVQFINWADAHCSLFVLMSKDLLDETEELKGHSIADVYAYIFEKNIHVNEHDQAILDELSLRLFRRYYPDIKLHSFNDLPYNLQYSYLHEMVIRITDEWISYINSLVKRGLL